MVRDAPIINDVTFQDARTVGMNQVAEVVSNGDKAPGTILSRCSAEFRKRFDRAELIISKGQGNFESLSSAAGPIFFLLRVKCRVVAQNLAVPKGSAILLESESRK